LVEDLHGFERFAVTATLLFLQATYVVVLGRFYPASHTWLGFLVLTCAHDCRDALLEAALSSHPNLQRQEVERLHGQTGMHNRQLMRLHTPTSP